MTRESEKRRIFVFRFSYRFPSFPLFPLLPCLFVLLSLLPSLLPLSHSSLCPFFPISHSPIPSSPHPLSCPRSSPRLTDRLRSLDHSPLFPSSPPPFLGPQPCTGLHPSCPRRSSTLPHSPRRACPSVRWSCLVRLPQPSRRSSHP